MPTKSEMGCSGNFMMRGQPSQWPFAQSASISSMAALEPQDNAQLMAGV